MKKSFILFCLLASAMSLNAATITFSNTDSGWTSLLAVVDSSGNEIANGSGSVSIGYFTDESAVASGDFSSFTQFGSSVAFGDGGAYNVASIYSGEVSQAIAGGSSFIGQNIYTFATFAGDALVAKSTTLFAADAPLFTTSMDIANDAGITYLFGGQANSSIQIFGAGTVPSIRMAAPEPSTYAALSGLLALSSVMLRRRRA